MANAQCIRKPTDPPEQAWLYLFLIRNPHFSQSKVCAVKSESQVLALGSVDQCGKTKHTHTLQRAQRCFASGVAVGSVSLQWTFGHVWTAGSSRAAAAVGQRLPLSALAGARCSGHLWRTGGSPGKVLKFYFTSSLFKQFSFVCILWQQEQTDNLCLDFLLLHFRTRQKMSEMCRYLVKKLFRGKLFYISLNFTFFIRVLD